jgi:hypothetical protein
MLAEVVRQGVEAHAYRCHVTLGDIVISDPIRVNLVDVNRDPDWDRLSRLRAGSNR